MTLRQAVTLYGNRRAVKILKQVPRNMSVLEAEREGYISELQAQMVETAVSHLPKHIRDLIKNKYEVANG